MQVWNINKEAKNKKLMVVKNRMNHKIQENPSPDKDLATFWFPGRWMGGLSLIIGPLLLLAAALLRIEFHYFYDVQLLAYANHPALIAAAYSCFVLGCLFLWPGIITLVRFIAVKHLNLAIWVACSQFLD